jgi:hypothetical protein
VPRPGTGSGAPAERGHANGRRCGALRPRNRTRADRRRDSRAARRDAHAPQLTRSQRGALESATLHRAARGNVAAGGLVLRSPARSPSIDGSLADHRAHSKGRGGPRSAAVRCSPLGVASRRPLPSARPPLQALPSTVSTPASRLRLHPLPAHRLYSLRPFRRKHHAPEAEDRDQRHRARERRGGSPASAADPSFAGERDAESAGARTLQLGLRCIRRDSRCHARLLGGYSSSSSSAEIQAPCCETSRALGTPGPQHHQDQRPPSDICRRQCCERRFQPRA